MNFITNIGPKKYLRIFIFISLTSIFLLSILAFKNLFFDDLFGYQILYNYQLKKLSTEEDVDTIFIGDSSLGNSINADLFSAQGATKALNLALTGNYGYAGSYNMLKKAVKVNKKIENVILMHTIGTMRRPIAFDGYLLTIDSLNDLTELKMTEQGHLIKAFYNSILSFENLKSIIMYYLRLTPKPSFYIENDYIKQNKRINTSNKTGPIGMTIAKNKTKFLLKIIKFCRKRRINLLYTHGPIWQPIGKVSTEYIKKINGILLDTKVNLVEKVVFVPNSDIGDSADHISPEMKDNYSTAYYHVLNPLLKTGNQQSFP